MKKRILTMLALCATIMCLAACDNEETNTNTTGGTTTATVTATPATQEKVDSSSTETENNAATTVEPTTAPTVEATVTPTEAPTVTEVSWEESGMSYELFENPDGTVAVIVTNNSDMICGFVVNDYPFTIEPNGKGYSSGFYTIDGAKEFVTKLENTTCKHYPYHGTVLTTELTCDVTNETNDKIDFTTDDLVAHFNNSTNLNVTWSKFTEAESNQNLILNNNGTVFHILAYNENNEIVAIVEASINDVIWDEIKKEYAYKGTTKLPSDLEYSKITMVMQYTWADGIFE